MKNNINPMAMAFILVVSIMGYCYMIFELGLWLSNLPVNTLATIGLFLSIACLNVFFINMARYMTEFFGKKRE